MTTRLEELARQLQRCRERGHKLTLQCVLDSAKILSEARPLAGRKWTHWLREEAHLDPLTARHHLAVGTFVKRNRDLTHEIANLSIAKIYKLSTLDSNLAAALISGRQRLSRPLHELSDVQFRQECRDRFATGPKKTTKEHVFRSTFSRLVKAEKGLHRALHFAKQMTLSQRRRIHDRVAALSRLVSDWKIVA